MEKMTISQVSKTFGISTRMLRYYEQEGLIRSFRQEGYSYRMYDDKAVNRIKQIIVLRKLRIPVRQIRIILDNTDAVAVIDIFQRNISELDEEITALSTIREILERFVEQLGEAAKLTLDTVISQDETLLEAIEALSLISINFKEDQTIEQLRQADKSLSKIRDIRILYLPPFTVAAAHYIGDEPEMNANERIDRFVTESGLLLRKPDLRRFGFNHPNPVDDTGYHGYEAWVTIPDDMELPPPLVKKRFAGGLYAAHMISFGNFNEWDPFLEWAMQSEKYEFAGDLQDQEHMCGLLEEHLNYYNHAALREWDAQEIQLDLLLPVKRK